MTCRAISKYLVRVSRTSSASRSSANGVKPTRSAKRTLTTRRSALSAPVGGWAVGATGRGRAPLAAAGAGPASAKPHSAQNFAPGTYGVEQLGQVDASAVPHSAQNFAVAALAVPQLEQFNVGETLWDRTALSIARAVATLDSGPRCGRAPLVAQGPAVRVRTWSAAIAAPKIG